MSEIKKNIETCRGEDVLAEVSGLPQDPHFGSLVNEAFDPMQQQALHQAGYDGYSEVIAQHKPYTFASFIVQMKSNLLLLLRALWQFHFGAGTLRSLSDMWSHYIDRLQGSETYGIPSRLDQLADLPSAPLLLSDRKISGADVADGMSLAQLLGGSVPITELIDNNEGWNMVRELPSYINAEKIVLGCETFTMPNYSTIFIRTATNLEELELPNLKYFYFVTGNYGNNLGLINNNDKLTRLELPNFEKISKADGTAGAQCDFLQNCTALEEFIAPKLSYIGCEYFIYGCTSLRKVVLGKLTQQWGAAYGSYENNFQSSTSNLVHLEIGEGTNISLNMSWWKPSAETIAHQDFLPNFRTYIAERLTDNGSGLTLTLSQAVFSSIWDANGNPQVLQDGLDQLRADIHNIVKTTKHWDVNKAN